MKRVLVANRGAIAVKIIKTLSRLGIESVSVYHSVEKDTLYTRQADIAVDIGGGALTNNFLNIDKLISVAKEYACDAIHPGYGFLSENYLFAKACEENGIVFIGPKSSVIRLMGLKSKAKEVAQEAKVPVLSSIPFKNIDAINADSLEYPILVKAIAGGGGRGLKIAYKAAEVVEAISSAQREARQYFGNDEVILEPFVENARHIEVQILGNEHGEILHLFERECSIQRNHQKIIEEAPAASLSNELREQLYAAAVRFAAQLNYTGAGTVEFLVSNDKFWFLEMNTRIQVEHAVSELITGIDIIEEQINIARGESFSVSLKKLKPIGHSIEARLYAENPYENFRPSAGQISLFYKPQMVRFDSFIEEGCQITPYFDSMLGKLIVHANNRQEAINKLQSDISELKVYGVRTNISYLNQILNRKDYQLNNISTTFIERSQKELVEEAKVDRKQLNKQVLIAAFVYNNFLKPIEQPDNIWQSIGTDSLNRALIVRVEKQDYSVRITNVNKDNFKLLIEEKIVQFRIISSARNKIRIKTNENIIDCFYVNEKSQGFDYYGVGAYVFRLSSANILLMASSFLNKQSQNNQNSINQIQSPLFGKVIDIKVSKHQKVSKGDVLVIIESMKTENAILSPGNGMVEEILVKKGQQVTENLELLKMNSIN